MEPVVKAPCKQNSVFHKQDIIYIFNLKTMRGVIYFPLQLEECILEWEVFKKEKALFMIFLGQKQRYSRSSLRWFRLVSDPSSAWLPLLYTKGGNPQP